MALSTQPYINAVESSIIIKKSPNANPTFYPKEFNKDIAELFGYILMAGTLTKRTVEINFSDGHYFTEMPKRIEEIYSNNWSQFFLRKNKYGGPRLCGRKTVAFVNMVFGGEQYILPGNEKVPAFVWQSDTDVVRGFLKGIIGSCPKAMKFFGAWLPFRNFDFFCEVEQLLSKHTTATFQTQPYIIVYDQDQLELLKEELELQHPSWWTSSTELKLYT